MKGSKRTTKSGCDTVTFLATCPVLGTPSQGVPRLAEHSGGQLTFFTSFSISILAFVSEELTRSRRIEQQLKKKLF